MSPSERVAPMKLSNSLSLLISASLLTLAACGSSTIGGGSGGGGATNTGTAGGDTGGTGGGTGGCASLDAPAKACSTDADCVTVLHQLNCCGTHVALGISKSAAAAYQTLEATCSADFPQCGCATEATKAEDGKTAADFSASIPVACNAGKCETYIPNGLCNGEPNPESCSPDSCPPGYACVDDPDPNNCYSSACGCDESGWVCTADCMMGGKHCVPASDLCNGVPSPVSCTDGSCPAGFVCTPDPDPNVCHPSGCNCDPANGWVCDDSCMMNGSSCVKGL